MPKRIIDGAGLWRSKKLRTVEPPTYRAEYANLLPLALANGVFECDPDTIWSDVYSFNRPDITPDAVRLILDAFTIAKLLFRWEAGGKMWGYWTGIEKPGRLPGESRRGINEAVGPNPSPKDLKTFMESIGIQNIPMDSNERLGLGFGLGSGLGLGMGLGEGGKSKPKEALSLDPQVFQECWNRNCGILPKIKSLTKGRKAKLRARMEAVGFEADFREAVVRCAQSPFCIGQNKQGWRVTFDWLISNQENIAKVLEGNYDGSAPPAKGQKREIVELRRNS